jgi:hypothetical protein
MDKLKLLSIRLRAVAVFRNLLDDSVINALSQLLSSLDSDVETQVDMYGRFVYELYAHTDNLSK